MQSVVHTRVYDYATKIWVYPQFQILRFRAFLFLIVNDHCTYSVTRLVLHKNAELKNPGHRIFLPF